MASPVWWLYHLCSKLYLKSNHVSGPMDCISMQGILTSRPCSMQMHDFQIPKKVSVRVLAAGLALRHVQYCTVLWQLTLESQYCTVLYNAVIAYTKTRTCIVLYSVDTAYNKTRVRTILYSAVTSYTRTTRKVCTEILEIGYEALHRLEQNLD